MVRHPIAEDLTASLTAEVVALCRKGLVHADPPDIPELRRLLNIPNDLPNVQALPMIRASIVDAAATLPPDHRLVFYESSGAWPGAPLGREKRLAAAAEAGNISERTARRWSEQVAPPLIVAWLLNNTDRAVRDASFAMTRLHVQLDLTKTSPVIKLKRTIRVLAPHMDGFYEEVSIPRLREGEPVWQGIYGCSVTKVASLGQRMWGINHSFPQLLQIGSNHSFTTSMRLPNHESLCPEIGFQPHNATLSARISIRFGRRLPSRIETFQTTGTPGSIPTAHITETLIPDRRDLRFEFAEIQLGYAVGIRWFWDK